MVTVAAVAAGREVLAMVVTTTLLLQLLATMVQAAMLCAMVTLHCTAEAATAC
jgi:hypothetical protein